MRRFFALLPFLGLACGDGGITSGTDLLCPDGDWQALRTNLDRSALAIWGDADDDVVVVGGALGAPGATLVSHWDGSAWTDIPADSTETLWWVWGAPGATTDVWMVGENGTVMRWDGTTVSAMPMGTSAHLYGVWGTSSRDVWIVGGRPGPDEGPDDVVLHWDGSGFEAVEVPARGAALFKVWGTGDELWATGEAGTILHRKGDGSWVDESAQVDTLDTLATVSGCSATEVYAVGGQSLYRYDGSRWAAVPEAHIGSNATGVSCGDAGVLVVGSGGLKLRYDRGSDTWIDETLEAPYDTDFHGAWVSPGGAFWAAGGNYVAPAPQIDRREGVLAVKGLCE